MDTLLVVVGVVNLLLVLAVLALVVTRTRDTRSEVDIEPVRTALHQMGGEIRQDLSAQRTELTQLLNGSQRHQTEELARQRATQEEAARTTADQLARGQDKVQSLLRTEAESEGARHTELRETLEKRLAEHRADTDGKLERIRETVDEKLRESLSKALTGNADSIKALQAESARQHREVQKLMQDELEKLRTGNEAKLEAMRLTVDEKLQGTLEKRLGESFSLVSERLEQVQKGLGEMQSLASDVGGLKRVLTNVKSRGTWGEVQLARQLEDILTAEQYEQNVVIRPGTGERVEFAVRLPGRDDDAPVYLPIDSKFPQEDYERLLEAQEEGEALAIEAAGKALERAIITQAKLISEKYIEPPLSTDFAIMYLPTEGLFAEVVRRAGLASKLQNDHRILITGPTTLMSLLNSLQMGFRTLAIEKRSSEVWQVLGAAKAEFEKYGSVWEKLERQLSTAQRTVKEAGTRTRAVERRLRRVETMEITGSTDLASTIGEIVEDTFDSDERESTNGAEDGELVLEGR